MFSKPYILKGDLYSKMEFSKTYIWFTEYMVYHMVYHVYMEYQTLLYNTQDMLSPAWRTGGLEDQRPGGPEDWSVATLKSVLCCWISSILVWTRASEEGSVMLEEDDEKKEEKEQEEEEEKEEKESTGMQDYC